jgi:ribonuclease HIII
MTGKTRFDELKAYIKSQGWHWGPGTTTPYDEQIVVSDAGLTALVNFWPKRSKMQVQGAASPLKAALQAWVDGEGTSASSAASPLVAGPHIGMDESGKGDWFGPLVVAAVYTDGRAIAALRQAGVRDSKELDPITIQRIAAQIERIVPEAQRHVWVIEPETYNRLYAEHGNLNVLLAEAYSKVAEKVWQSTRAPTIVCDQFSQKEKRLETAFAQLGLPRPLQRHKAESLSVAVAAASILASAAFAAALDQLGRQDSLGYALPKGASDHEVLEAAARRIIAAHGSETLGRYAKLNFKPVQTLLGIAGPKASPGTSDTQPRGGPPVTIKQPVWQLQYHPSGFWRFTFVDGGILDWYESTTGKLDVRGKPAASSYQILKEKADGKIWKRDLEAIEKSIASYIPQFIEASAASVLGVGWGCRDTVLGVRFDFTDGAVLQYYRSSDRLLMQGKPSEPTRKALEMFTSPFWPGLDRLTDNLKALFPDWRLGPVIASSEESIEAGDAAGSGWQPLEGSLNWDVFWPADHEKRRSANKKAPCQREMADDWASVLVHHQGKHHLLAHAPTGLGKTLAALVPALAWVAQAPDRRRVYYLVNRVAQHDNPIRELRAGLAATFETQTGQPLRVVDIVGRHLLCRYPQVHSLPDLCKRSRESASFGLLPDGVSTWQEVKTHLGNRACPYHTLQGLMAKAHVIICDYWWLFSQMAQAGERRGQSLMEQAGFSPEDSILIVDEAHNLPPRVRAELDVDEPMEPVENAIRRAPAPVRACLEPVVAAVKQANTEEGLLPSKLLALAGGGAALQAALNTMATGDSVEARAAPPERILRALLQPDEAAVVYSPADAKGGRRLVCRLVDPTPMLGAGYSRAWASLSMSGTLAAPSDDSRELRYQVPLFGLSLRETLTRKYASPFPLRNQRWIYSTDTYGTYRERDRHLPRYAEHIISIGRATPGVTAVFFSSYAFLESVRASIADAAEQALIVAEARADAEGVTESISNLGDYEQRLRGLVQQHGRAYLFAVYKGKLSEGADFAGNLIKSVVCVSIPLEYPGLYHERLQALYRQALAPVVEELGDDLNEKAREYALDRLSLSLVLQACGRGIRNATDKCALVLSDRRYGEYGWRRFLEPRPYNVRIPKMNVQEFHQARITAPGLAWDPALI